MYMYCYLISALVTIAVTVCTIVAKRWDDDDNYLFKPGVRVAPLVASGGISGAVLAAAAVCCLGRNDHE